jgi:hypothetical protein
MGKDLEIEGQTSIRLLTVSLLLLLEIKKIPQGMQQ